MTDTDLIYTFNVFIVGVSDIVHSKSISIINLRVKTQ